MYIKYLFYLAATVVLAMGFVYCSKSTISEKDAKQVLQQFYSDDAPESINDRFLLQAGKPIVPYVAAEIADRNMPKRRYAIIVLGTIGDARALPALEKIINDQTESAWIRGDALTAIWHINKEMGKEYARKYGGDKGYIDRTIQLLTEGAI